MPLKILLLGGNGQVGSELQNILPYVGEVKVCDRVEADFENPESLRVTIRDHRPDIIVNAAAYTAVDKAESEPEKATRINADAVGLLAEEAKRIRSWLVHYSTDYVFDGISTEPYTEVDQPNPLNVYGKTKLLGEEAIRQSECKHLIFRTSWVYGAGGGNFIKTILCFAKERDSLKIVADQYGTPTSAALIAEVTAKAIKAILNGKIQSGTYHLTSSGDTNWYELAKHIVSRAHRIGMPLRLKPESIQPILTIDYPTPAKRPMNSRLNTSHLIKTFNISLPDWQQDVDRFLNYLISNEQNCET